jgi:DNA-binding transcriptional regulator YdaS (Cro superfamily)
VLGIFRDNHPELQAFGRTFFSWHTIIQTSGYVNQPPLLTLLTPPVVDLTTGGVKPQDMSSVRDLIASAAHQMGSETKLATACGVTQNAIWQAKTRGRISAELALAIHRATRGKVGAHDLRPDLWISRRHVPREKVAA